MQAFFLGENFEAIFLRSNVKSLLEWYVADREATIVPREERALSELTWIPIEARAEKPGRTRTASRLQYGHKYR